MFKGNRDVVVIGASAGGVAAISRLTQKLPSDLPASVMVVLHISPSASRTYHLTLCGKSKLACTPARHGDRPEHGRVFVAVPDRHLRLIGANDDLRLQIDRGPRESRSRPSIDALFRSAAGSSGARTIGVLLTGYLDDGVNGLAAIQRSGGKIVVQDSGDAEVPDLPRRALDTLAVDHTAKLADMADVIVELVREKAELADIPTGLRTEAAIAARAADLWPELEQIGDRAALSCPQCGGPLWTLQGGGKDEHFRCHVGHAFSPMTLLDDQNTEIERAMHSAIRIVEEKARFLAKMANTSEGNSQFRFREEAAAAKADAQILRDFLAGQRDKRESA